MSVPVPSLDAVTVQLLTYSSVHITAHSATLSGHLSASQRPPVPPVPAALPAPARPRGRLARHIERYRLQIRS